jgi:hypothetical protein
MAVSETRRVILIGRVPAGKSRTAEVAVAVEEPQWHPAELEPGEPDADLIRKQRIEDEL